MTSNTPASFMWRHYNQEMFQQHNLLFHWIKTSKSACTTTTHAFNVKISACQLYLLQLMMMQWCFLKLFIEERFSRCRFVYLQFVNICRMQNFTYFDRSSHLVLKVKVQNNYCSSFDRRIRDSLNITLLRYAYSSHSVYTENSALSAGTYLSNINIQTCFHKP